MIAAMDAEDDMAPANSEDGPDSVSNHRSSSLSLSQNSPSIPAEGDWVEAADLDGDRWVKAEDLEDKWGEAALPPPRTSRVNDLDSYPHTSQLDADAPQSGLDSQQPAVDFNLQSRVNSATMPVDDVIETSAPSPKRPRLSSSPMRVKSPAYPTDKPSYASHHALIPIDPLADVLVVALSSAYPASKEETVFTEAVAGSNADSEDDTGSSGDVSASLRQFHAARQAHVSPHSIMAGSASGDDNLGSQEAQASSHGFDSDDDSESSDGFEGVPSQYCINCMSRMYLGDVMCLVSPTPLGLYMI